MIIWNLVHGCHRKSEGCLHCYVFARDEENGIDTNVVHKTTSWNLPMKKNRKGEWKIAAHSIVMTCFSSDFFLEEIDPWRNEAWNMMRLRKDLSFYIVTKRPERIAGCLPDYWIELQERVFICCTMESQQRVDERLPTFQALPIIHKEIIVEPMLEQVDFRRNLNGIEKITVGGESGMNARPCQYEWVLDVRRQCVEAGIHFHFMQTGAQFIKSGRTFHLSHRLQIQQAHKAQIDF